MVLVIIADLTYLHGLPTQANKAVTSSLARVFQIINTRMGLSGLKASRLMKDERANELIYFFNNN